MSSSSVLVSGTNGYMAAATIQELVHRGYNVKGTIHPNDSFLRQYPDASSSIEWSSTPSSDALRGVDYIIHVASPLFFILRGDGQSGPHPPLLRALATFPNLPKLAASR